MGGNHPIINNEHAQKKNAGTNTGKNKKKKQKKEGQTPMTQ